jgi:hypothetical protein
VEADKERGVVVISRLEEKTLNSTKRGWPISQRPRMGKSPCARRGHKPWCSEKNKKSNNFYAFDGTSVVYVLKLSNIQL